MLVLIQGRSMDGSLIRIVGSSTLVMEGNIIEGTRSTVATKLIEDGSKALTVFLKLNEV